MSLLPLTYGGWTYDRTLPLQTGAVRIEGVELNSIPLRIEELFYRVFHHHEFDITEMSLSAYMMAIDKGPWEYVAVPVFLSRMFRHSAIFVRSDRGINEDHQALEKAYFRATGIFPIMHTVGIRRSLVEQHPWLPVSVVKAFAHAKEAALRDIYGTGGALKASVPWLVEAVEEARSLMGHDHWPYGIARNRAALDAVARWSHAQGLTSHPLTPHELFAPSTHGEFKI